MAEAVRGGLQAMPEGQHEAATALGLGYWRATGLIVLPQALRIALPAMTNEFIALVKNTTLVLIVSILDLLGIAQAALADPELGRHEQGGLCVRRPDLLARLLRPLARRTRAGAQPLQGGAALMTCPSPSATSRRNPPASSTSCKRARVGLIVDTRAVAASRRPGFSKRQLAAGLDEAGIGYLHLQKLGTPKEGRDAARSGNLTKLFDIYEKQLATPEAREQLDELTAIVSQAGRCACSATSATSVTATASASPS